MILAFPHVQNVAVVVLQSLLDTFQGDLCVLARNIQALCVAVGRVCKHGPTRLARCIRTHSQWKLEKRFGNVMLLIGSGQALLRML